MNWHVKMSSANLRDSHCVSGVLIKAFSGFQIAFTSMS